MDLKLYPLDRQECEMRIASCKQSFVYIFSSIRIDLFTFFRRLDDGRSDLPVERKGARPDRQGLEFAKVQAGEVQHRLLQHSNKYRRIFVPKSPARVQTRVFLLPLNHLRAVVHAGHSVLGQLLVGFEISSGKSCIRSNHAVDNVHSDGRSQPILTTCRIY